MLTPGADLTATVKEINLKQLKSELAHSDYISAVGHEVTAERLSSLGIQVTYNRVNLLLKEGDVVYSAIPNLRYNEPREFTKDEVVSAMFRYFIIYISKNN